MYICGNKVNCREGVNSFEYIFFITDLGNIYHTQCVRHMTMFICLKVQLKRINEVNNKNKKVASNKTMFNVLKN